MIPLPESVLSNVSVTVDVEHGPLGGDARVISQRTYRAQLGNRLTENGALVVKLHWWFNGWSYVKYTVHVSVTAAKQIHPLSTTGRTIQASENCPANDWAQTMLSNIQCFYISAGVNLNADFTPAGGPSLSPGFCPAPLNGTTVSHEPPYYCPKNGNPNPGSGIYCLPDWP